MGYIGFMAKDKGHGKCRARFWHLLVDDRVGSLYCLDERFVDRATRTILLAPRQEGEEYVLHHVTGADLGGQGTGYFAFLMPSHTVGNDVQPHRSQPIVVMQCNVDSQIGIFITLADLTDITDFGDRQTG